MSEQAPVYTPTYAMNAALWLTSLDTKELAWIQGAALQRLAMLLGVTEAYLYTQWAERAAADPDCNVVREP